MRQRFEQLPDLDPQHNEIHRKAYQTPYLIDFVATVPTADDLEKRKMVFCTADNKFYINVDGIIKSVALS